MFNSDFKVNVRYTAIHTLTLKTDPIAIPMPSDTKDTMLPITQNTKNLETLNGTPTIKKTMVQNNKFSVICTGNFDTVSAA